MQSTAHQFKLWALHNRLRLWCLWLLGTLVTGFANAATPLMSEWVDIRIEAGQILIPSMIDGQQGESIINMGSRRSFVNSAFLSAHTPALDYGRDITVAGVHKNAQQPFVRLLPIDLFGKTMVLQFPLVAELGSSDIQMLLGGGFLQRLIFQFDFPNQRMRLMPRNSLNLRKAGNVVTKRDSPSGLPMVRVRLNDEANLWLTLNTGMTSGMLVRKRTARRHGWLEKFPTKTTVSQGIHSTADMLTFNLPTMEIGPYTLESPIVSVTQGKKELAVFQQESILGPELRTASPLTERFGVSVKNFGNQSDGFLGYDVLKHFVLTVDYKTAAVHLSQPEPGFL